MKPDELKFPEWEAKQTVLQKLSEFMPIKCENNIWEFKYVEQGSDGNKYIKTYRSLDMANKFIPAEDGKDWTTENIKACTMLSVQIALNMRVSRKELLSSQEEMGYPRRVWLGIMQRLIIDNYQMETPISITEETDVDFVTIKGRVYAHKNGTLNL